MTEFQPFPKIPRLFKPIVITEKLDGTNAQVHITEDGEVLAGSRTKYLDIHDDNLGFANWVKDNESELLKLGPGRHFGEWWGKGINRGYDMSTRRFSLFNVRKWSNNPDLPACCHVVPIICGGEYSERIINVAIHALERYGSFAAPGYMNPEGLMLYHTAANNVFKIPLDTKPKGQQ